MRSPLFCFLNLTALGLNSAVLSMSTVHHNVPWAVFSGVMLLYSAWQVTREIYL